MKVIYSLVSILVLCSCANHVICDNRDAASPELSIVLPTVPVPEIETPDAGIVPLSAEAFDSAWYVYTEPGLVDYPSFAGALMLLDGGLLTVQPCAPTCGGPCREPYINVIGCRADHTLNSVDDPYTYSILTTSLDIEITIERIDVNHNLYGTVRSGDISNTFEMIYLGLAH